VDPSDLRIKRLALPLFQAEIEMGSPISRAVREQTALVASRGYAPQIELHEGMLTLFLHCPGRQAISIVPDGFQIKATGDHYSRAALLGMLAEHPEHFSPNAAARPLMQDFLFPTLTIVLGPSEMAYFSQLPKAYAALGIAMPVLVPRPGFTLLEQRIDRLLAKLGVDVPQIIHRREAIVDDLVRREIPPSLLARFERTRAETSRMWEELAIDIGRLDSTLRRTTDLARGRSAKQLEFLEGKLLKAMKKRSQILAKPGGTYRNRHRARFIASRTRPEHPPVFRRYGDAVLQTVWESMDLRLPDPPGREAHLMKLDILAIGAHPDDVELGAGGTSRKPSDAEKRLAS